MSGRNVNSSDVLDARFDAALLDLHTALPGVVKSYDATKQVADIQPTIKRIDRDENGAKVVLDPPVISSVPIVWPRAGGYFLTFPLAPGDSVLLVFCESDLGAWLDSGAVAHPGDEGRHTLSGAVAIPGLFPVAGALSAGDAGTGHLVVGKAAGPQIHIDAATVQLGAAGGQFVALSNLVDARFAAIHDALAAVVPAPPSGPDVGEPGLLALQSALAAAFASTAASKAKAT